METNSRKKLFYGWTIVGVAFMAKKIDVLPYY